MLTVILVTELTAGLVVARALGQLVLLPELRGPAFLVKVLAAVLVLSLTDLMHQKAAVAAQVLLAARESMVLEEVTAA
jgi:hypothetical protein